MKKNISISVVVAIYNAEKYLEECLCSILQQTQHDIEVICVDDDSTDNSLTILRSFAASSERVQVYHHANCGAGASRNWGATFASGKYIVFLDADDFFEPDFLQRMYEEAERQQNDITICNYYRYDNMTQMEYEIPAVGDSRFQSKVFGGNELLDSVFEYQGFRGAAWNKLYRREFLMQIGDYFLESRKCDGCEDMFFSIVASMLAKRITILSMPLVHYRENIGNSLSVRKFSALKESPFWALLAIYGEIIKRNMYMVLRERFSSFVVRHLYGYLIDVQMELSVRREFYVKMKDEWWPACNVCCDNISKTDVAYRIYLDVMHNDFEKHEELIHTRNMNKHLRLLALVNDLSDKRVVIWGKGDKGNALKVELLKMGCKCQIDFVDTNSNCEEEHITRLRGKNDSVYVLVSMEKYYPEVEAFLQKQGFKENEGYWYVSKVNC